MQLVTEISLPVLPLDRPDFGVDPMLGYEDTCRAHSWLAKFSPGVCNPRLSGNSGPAGY
jgi:hypothetical protein